MVLNGGFMFDQNQRRLLPSTSMLMAFDAAARTESFTIAAQELNLTQGAVSKQICALEEQLGTVFFERGHQKVTMTDAGREYAKEIQVALGVIRSASLKAMTGPKSGIMNLAILPTFGTRWLMPRLPSFLSESPDITISFVTKTSPFDFRSEELDAAIHYGTANWPNTHATYLMGEEVVPVCAPNFMDNYTECEPYDIISAPLLHISSRPHAWSDWFSAQGLDGHGKGGMHFEQFTTAAQAAAAGLGIALLPKFLVQKELSRGELVLLIEEPMKSEYGYYLVTPTDKVDYAPVVAFCNWLLTQIKEDNQPLI